MENHPSGASEDIATKFRGTLVGAAVGDALGAPFEGAPRVKLTDLERLARESGPLRYTDGTHMTLGMAQSLVERRGFDGAHMAAVFASNFSKEPWRGYGAGPPQVFRLLGQGVPWDQAGRALFNGKGSLGNGAAMRVAPASLLAFRDLGMVVSLARQTAIITHAHEMGIEGAVLQACAVTLALREDRQKPICHERFLDALLPHLHSSAYQRKIEGVKALLSSPEPIDREMVISELGNGIQALDSGPTAIYAFLLYSGSFRDVVTYAISLGGDTDTIACMAGALAGAYLGVQGIPESWRKRVEGADQLEGLADSLLPLALEAEP